MMMMDCSVLNAGLSVPTAECLVLAQGLDGPAVMRLKHMLQDLRFMVRIAGSVNDAVLMAGHHHPVLVLAGVQGMERLLPRLKLRHGEEWLRQVAKLAILNDGTPDEVLRLMVMGVDECLVWPFSRQMLARRLGRVRQFA